MHLYYTILCNRISNILFVCICKFNNYLLFELENSIIKLKVVLICNAKVLSQKLTTYPIIILRKQILYNNKPIINNVLEM